ncbi:unnamed protein product [Cylindrotheca closterium]|uniref:Uncharacterized protein n=1 Tax=Cylindrotheca closterium TaxID=2856 RepID=A0AAD2PWB7_9STRA|nr:unnamed protein product [Cylindrotheca closterium]
MAASSSSTNTKNAFSQQHSKKSKAEILEVKRKAISLLTTAYKTDSDEQVVELETQLKDLLHLIRSEDDLEQKATATKSFIDSSATTSPSTMETKKVTSPISPPSPPRSTTAAPGILLRDFNGRKPKPDPIESHIGEIKKPLKQFHVQTAIEPIKPKKGMVAGMQQEALLEAAMGRKQERDSNGWLGFIFGPNDDASETGFKEFGEMGGKELRKKQNRNRQRATKRRSSANCVSDAFSGMIVTTTTSKNGTKSPASSQASSISSSSFDSEDDVSTLGTEPTYESVSERMTGFLRVRRLPTTAEEEDEAAPEGGESKQRDILQDTAEEEAQQPVAVEGPTWGWFQPRAQQVQGPA